MPLAEELEDEEERRRSSSRWVEIFGINDFFNFLHALAISMTVKKGKIGENKRVILKETVVRNWNYENEIIGGGGGGGNVNIYYYQGREN